MNENFLAALILGLIAIASFTGTFYLLALFGKLEKKRQIKKAKENEIKY